jgi:hypothetical protein
MRFAMEPSSVRLPASVDDMARVIQARVGSGRDGMRA